MIHHGFGVGLTDLSQIPSEFIRNWRNDPRIYKWCRQYEPLNKWDHEKWLSSLPNRSNVKMFGILPDDKTSHAGVCGLTDIDYVNSRAEFSLYIEPENQSFGYGNGALKTLCAHGFLALGLEHIFGETFDGNPAAQMFEKVGFIKEGSRRSYYYRDGKFIDAHLYSILNKEFRDKWKL